MKIGTLLSSIGSTEPSTFGEVCQALGDDKPSDRDEWREFFGLANAAEKEGLIEVEKLDGKIESMILTEAGVAKLKEMRQ